MDKSMHPHLRLLLLLGWCVVLQHAPPHAGRHLTAAAGRAPSAEHMGVEQAR